MICEKVLGTVPDDAPDVDWVDLPWLQTTRRALRLRSRAGRQVDVLLPRNHQLKHGDVLAETEGMRVAVAVSETDVLILSARSLGEMARLATELGNLHAPVEVRDASIIAPDDGPVLEIAEALGVPYTRARLRFHPLRCSVQQPISSSMSAD